MNKKLINTSLEKVLLTHTIPLVINKTTEEKIKFLCRKIPTLEWSGVLFYTVEGTIQDPENCKIFVQDLLLMDKGSSSFTSYDFNEDVIEYIMEEEERMEWKMGH